MSRWIEAYISLLKCADCDAITPNLIFSSDTDMVSNNLYALNSVVKSEIVITEVVGGNIEARTNERFDRTDLRHLQILRVTEVECHEGVSFQDSSIKFLPPVVVYVCPYCGGEASEFKKQRPSDFKAQNGTILVTLDLDIRDC